MATPTPEYGANRITAQRVQRTHTKTPDWLQFLPVPDNALRVYNAVRAFIYEKDPKAISVRITDPELAELTHRSVKSVQRARRAAEKCGLIHEVRRWTESAGYKSARTVRELAVQLDPPDWLAGPTNCWEIRETLEVNGGPGIGWTNLTTRSDQEPPEEGDVSPVQFGRSDSSGGHPNLSGGHPNLSGGHPNLSEHPGDDVHERAPQEVLQEEEQEANQEEAASAATGWLAEEQPKDSGAEAPSTSEEEPSSSETRTVTEIAEHYAVPARLIESVAERIQQQVPSWEPHPVFLRGIAAKLATRQVAPDDIVRAATDNAPSPQVVSQRIKGWLGRDQCGKGRSDAHSGSQRSTRGDGAASLSSDVAKQVAALATQFSSN